MGILKVAGKVLLIPLWFIISIIGAGVKLLVHMVAIAKKILGLGIMALFIGTVICYQDWLQATFLACDMIPSSRTQKYKNLLGGILCPEKVKLMQ